MQDIIESANYHRTRVYVAARAHYLATKLNSKMHLYLGVSVAIITSIVGTAIFASFSEKPDPSVQMFAGLLSLLAAVLSTLQTFFKHAELSEKHRVLAARYSSIRRKLDMFILKYKDESNRTQVITDLSGIFDTISVLESESLDVPDNLYNKAREEYNKSMLDNADKPSS